MRLPFRHSWQLRRIERRLCRSEPHLAAMLVIFARLSAGEAATGLEYLPGPMSRVRLVLTVLAGAVTAAAAAAAWALRKAGSLCARTLRLGRRGRAPLSAAPTARGATGPGRPLGR